MTSYTCKNASYLTVKPHMHCAKQILCQIRPNIFSPASTVPTQHTWLSFLHPHDFTIDIYMDVAWSVPIKYCIDFIAATRQSHRVTAQCAYLNDVLITVDYYYYYYYLFLVLKPRIPRKCLLHCRSQARGNLRYIFYRNGQRHRGIPLLFLRKNALGYLECVT